MPITIVVSNAVIRGKLTRLAANLKPESLLKVIGLRLLSYVDKQFKTRGEGSWRPLAASTIALRQHGGDAPLMDVGNYRGAFVDERGGPGKDFATDNYQTYVSVGSSRKTANGIPLAAIHERGTGPYIIRVKQARVLAAQTRAGPWMIFGREVHHPGIPARPVLPTVGAAKKMAVDVINEMAQMDAAASAGDTNG